jgi:hypothetical protein
MVNITTSNTTNLYVNAAAANNDNNVVENVANSQITELVSLVLDKMIEGNKAITLQDVSTLLPCPLST